MQGQGQGQGHVSSRPTSSSSSSVFSRPASPMASPRSPHRAHSQGSKLRKSNKLQASGRRAMGSALIHPAKGGNEGEDTDTLQQTLANTMDKNKFNAMIARRNSHIHEQLSTVHSEERIRHPERPQQDDRQLYASISAEQVEGIDFSDYGF